MSSNEITNLPLAVDLLDDKKSITVLNSENETILQSIMKELEADKYNSIVTMENFKDMKESSLELGKTSKFISSFRISKKKEEMTHIDEFEANLKGYCKLIDEKQNEIKSGLDVFEEQTRQSILSVCKEYFNQYTDKVGLREEFRNINIDDMTLSKYATAKLQISKNGKDEVEKRVNEKLSLQNKVDNRILSLENECLKAGIIPLTQQHIQGFLYSDDETYNNNLRRLIDCEVERNKKVAEQERLKAEAKAREEIRQEQSKVEEKTPFEEEEREEVKEVEKPIGQKQEVAVDGKVLKTISLTVNVKQSTPDDALLEHIFRMIDGNLDKFKELFKVV